MPSALLIAPEGLPFSKTGGLADVVGALPPALARLGWQTTVVMPQYGPDRSGAALARHTVTLGGTAFSVGFIAHPLASGATAVLIDCPELFDRPGLYSVSAANDSHGPLRSAVLNIAALEYAMRQDAPPAIVHAHDWEAALALVYLRTTPRFASHLGAASTVMTIHNLAYQGIFDADWMGPLDLPADQFDIEKMEFWGKINLLKAGIVHSDLVTTVSPTYAKEIQTPTFGFGLDGVLRNRTDDLVGILNGIDVSQWSPAHDKFLPRPFDVDDLSGKAIAKRALLTRFGLPVDDIALTRPVFGMISRMADQKGFDLLTEARDHLLGIGAAFVVLGSGEPRYEQFWRHFATEHPDAVGVYIGFDEPLAHLIEAGADAFVMPSRFEPCGLNQMYSLAYGTLPIVRAVGGLADTIDTSVGFPFDEYSVDALVAALREAKRTYTDEPARWAEMMTRAMSRDHSWDNAARQYSGVYTRAISKHLGSLRPE